MGWLLALDGATDQLSLALCGPDGQALTRELAGGALASATLIPTLRELLGSAGVAGESLQGIAFGQGPGAFTSLRAICAVTQGLAYGWQLPVLALDSLMLVAEDAAETAPEEPVWQVLMDARMGELYTARYARDAGGGWRAIEAPALEPAAACTARLQAAAPAAASGSGQALLAAPALRWHTGRSRAAALARLARWQAAQGPWLDAAQALPLYVRDKVAQTTAERLAAKAAL